MENPPPPAAPRAPIQWRSLTLLSLIWSGLILTEQISATILPHTCRQFTENAFLISCILGLNRLFGFIANPIVGILSDKIWTPLGRRSIFLVTGAPILALCLWLIPEARILWQLIVLVAFYQFFQDVLWGSNHPLIADLIPVQQRTLAAGLMMTLSQAVSYVFSKYCIGHLAREHGENTLYLLVAGAQLLLVVLPAFLIREQKRDPVPRPPLNLRRYITDLAGHPILRRFALLAFFSACFTTIIQQYLVLFATKTLGLSLPAFGEINSIQPLLLLLAAIPFGIFVEKFVPKQKAIVAGYLLATAACAYGYYAQNANDLLMLCVGSAIGQLILNVTQRPFFTEYVPPELMGQLSGAYNICHATGALVGTIGCGWVVEQFYQNDWRGAWPLCAGCALIAAFIAATLPDTRYEDRKRGR